VAVLWQVFELDNEGNMKHTVLGSDLAAGQTPQYEIKPMVWFGAYPTNDTSPPIMMMAALAHC
jgi:predicted cupin superfamily sugar epimerase